MKLLETVCKSVIYGLVMTLFLCVCAACIAQVMSTGSTACLLIAVLSGLILAVLGVSVKTFALRLATVS